MYVYLYMSMYMSVYVYVWVCTTEARYALAQTLTKMPSLGVAAPYTSKMFEV